MADTLTRKERSQRMGLIRGKDTAPEMAIRSLVHKLGFRYRLHGKDLPGKPDLVFKRRKKVIFIHGCFWHRHPDKSCKLARLPKSRLDFWEPKLLNNAARDRKNIKQLESLGWNVLVIWECELKDKTFLNQTIQAFLEP